MALPATPTAPISKSNQPEGKLGFAGGLTVSERLTELVRLLHVPVIVRVKDPTLAVLLAFNVNTAVVFVLFGFSDAVTPLGKPDIDKLTFPLNPPCGAMVIVLMPLTPRAMPRAFGDAVNE